MVRPLLSLGVPAALVLLAGCSTGDAAAGKSTVRDSAGVRVVESQAPAWKEGEGWRIAERPSLSIGSEDDPAYQLGHVAGAVRLSGGGIAVADEQAGELRLYDAAGRHLRTLGKKGSGPGEFRALGSLFLLPGDSLGAWDPYAVRLTVFTPAGELARSVTVTPTGPGGVLELDGIFPGGALLVDRENSMVFRNAPKPSRDSVWLYRYRPDGTAPDSVVRYAGPETVTLVGTDGGGWATRSLVPFGGQTLHRVESGRLYLADNARFEVEVRAPDGRLLRRMRRAHTPEPLTPDEVRAHRARQMDHAEPRFRAMLERMAAAMPYPATKAAFEQMQVDRTGAVWLRAYVSPGAETARWTVLDAEGRWLGEVPLPAEMRVMEIGADYLLAVRKDDLDVERVELYRLQKPGEA